MIKRRYPFLQQFYFEWREIYKSAFKRQECYLGSGKDVFPEIHKRIAWEMEGFLIKYWIALQDNIDKMEYKPFGTYRLEKSGIGE